MGCKSHGDCSGVLADAEMQSPAKSHKATGENRGESMSEPAQSMDCISPTTPPKTPSISSSAANLSCISSFDLLFDFRSYTNGSARFRMQMLWPSGGFCPGVG